MLLSTATHTHNEQLMMQCPAQENLGMCPVETGNWTTGLVLTLPSDPKISLCCSMYWLIDCVYFKPPYKLMFILMTPYWNQPLLSKVQMNNPKVKLRPMIWKHIFLKPSLCPLMLFSLSPQRHLIGQGVRSAHPPPRRLPGGHTSALDQRQAEVST